jgi:very-short-patch-repair endonuclease
MSRDGAEVLGAQLQACGHVGWLREHKFHDVRRWRFDLAHPAHMLAVEVEGFAPGGMAGRHQRPAGFNADCEKYAEAVIAGWRVMRVTTKQVRSGEALQWIERAIIGN